jgi:hypothetical protein
MEVSLKDKILKFSLPSESVRKQEERFRNINISLIYYRTFENYWGEKKTKFLTVKAPFKGFVLKNKVFRLTFLRILFLILNDENRYKQLNEDGFDVSVEFIINNYLNSPEFNRNTEGEIIFRIFETINGETVFFNPIYKELIEKIIYIREEIKIIPSIEGDIYEIINPIIGDLKEKYIIPIFSRNTNESDRYLINILNFFRKSYFGENNLSHTFVDYYFFEEKKQKFLFFLIDNNFRDTTNSEPSFFIDFKYSNPDSLPDFREQILIKNKLKLFDEILLNKEDIKTTDINFFPDNLEQINFSRVRDEEQRELRNDRLRYDYIINERIERLQDDEYDNNLEIENVARSLEFKKYLKYKRKYLNLKAKIKN